MVVGHSYFKLNKGEAEELWVEVKNMLKRAQPPKTNLKKEEIKAIKELREDDIRMM